VLFLAIAKSNVMLRTLVVLASVVVATLGAGMARYNGVPDLALTSTVVAAGGGTHHFEAARLLGALLGSERTATFQAHYGKGRVTRFAHTFTYAIDDALRVATKGGAVLPAPSYALAHNGRRLCGRLLHDGTMADGRFDIGYLIERLVSRPVHKAIMRDINANSAYGPAANADFHVLFTDAIGACKAEYRL
jgi:hypothetical protein